MHLDRFGELNPIRHKDRSSCLASMLPSSPDVWRIEPRADRGQYRSSRRDDIRDPNMIATDLEDNRRGSERVGGMALRLRQIGPPLPDEWTLRSLLRTRLDFDMGFELRPAGTAVLMGERMLRISQLRRRVTPLELLQ